jgi:hypothetical protein
LILGLLVTMRDHAVEKGAGPALVVTVGFGLLDLAVQVGGGLFVLALVAGVVLVEVLGCGGVLVWLGQEYGMHFELLKLHFEKITADVVLTAARRATNVGWQHLAVGVDLRSGSL